MGADKQQATPFALFTSAIGDVDIFDKVTREDVEAFWYKEGTWGKFLQFPLFQ
jgi:hypothetical protein